MTSRLPIECTECGATTTTRSQLGHSSYQEFAYACPRCSTEIRFGMDLFPERAAWEYRFLKNCRRAEAEEPQGHELRFDSENLSSRIPNAIFMPFMETAFFAKDFEKSLQSFGAKFGAMRDGWPVLEKQIVHEANGNLVLFNKCTRKAGGKTKARSDLEMRQILTAGLERFGSEYLLDEGRSRERVYALISASKGKKSLLDFDAFFRSENRLANLWTQLVAIRKSWSSVYHMVAPIYRGLDWDPAKANLDDYTLCQKRFEELQPFYVNCFETFCRMAVVGAALEGVESLDRNMVPLTKGPRPVEELEVMPNGNMHTWLNQLQHGDLFVPFIDAKLRNGVGHHAAHYDVTIDSVVYTNHSPARGIENFTISYVRFCEKIVRLYGQIETCAPLVHFLRIREIQSRTV